MMISVHFTLVTFSSSNVCRNHPWIRVFNDKAIIFGQDKKRSAPPCQMATRGYYHYFFFEKLIFLLKIQKELKIYYFGNQSTKIKQRHLGFRIYELKIQVLGKAIPYFNVSLMIESNTSQSWVMEFIEARYVAYKRGDD